MQNMRHTDFMKNVLGGLVLSIKTWLVVLVGLYQACPNNPCFSTNKQHQSEVKHVLLGIYFKTLLNSGFILIFKTWLGSKPYIRTISQQPMCYICINLGLLLSETSLSTIIYGDFGVTELHRAGRSCH